MSAREKIIKIGLPFIILIAVGFVMMIMIKSRKSPEKVETVDRGALVEYVMAEKSSRAVMINSTGTVQPRQEVTITPQVNGNVTSISPFFYPGGFFKEGDTLFEIETVDYQLALEQARAAMAKREFELSSVQSKARIARREWDRMKKGQEAPENSLALYGPQLKDANANLTSARAAVKQAELNLSRTRVVAPFNCVVRSEKIDVGQYVRAGNGVAVISSTDSAEVVVPVDLDDLQWLEIPGANGKGSSSPANIVLQSGSRSFSWPGAIDRLLAEVDPQGRMARLVVSITDPYLLEKGGAQEGPALAIGSFIEVEFRGKAMENVFALPRPVLRDDNTVWLMDAEGRLRIRKVVPIRLERKDVFIRDGLETGDKVIITNLTGAADGMKLRSNIENMGQGDNS